MSIPKAAIQGWVEPRLQALGLQALGFRTESELAVKLTVSSGDGHHRLRGFSPATVGEGSSTSSTYRDLKAWQRAMDTVQDIYRLTREFPREETYGLTIQLRRAAVSIASNIADGKGRSSDKELLYFLSNAKGSV